MQGMRKKHTAPKMSTMLSVDRKGYFRRATTSLYFIACSRAYLLDGVEVQIGVASQRSTVVSEEEQRRILAEEEIERIAAAAAKQAKMDAERGWCFPWMHEKMRSNVTLDDIFQRNYAN